ncbi:hypothetical protein HCU64_24925 [Methylobacterium sp. C25]|uniref:hypothetical protein n=1 Tax=Methylobacterium sp. C25 TaxID=2721622 RepID=UPI001F385EBD|nr:hypothetical protein [Methylobacterium sp. C25]MCE4226983.1 hypothetical protein [Methylobacterium sp. C25]
MDETIRNLDELAGKIEDFYKRMDDRTPHRLRTILEMALIDLGIERKRLLETRGAPLF